MAGFFVWFSRNGMKEIFQKKIQNQEVNSVLFEKMYLQVRNFLNWQYDQKKKKPRLDQSVQKKSFSYSRELPSIRRGNLYIPKGKKTEELPLIIDIHGGGWIHGDKDLYDEYNSALASQGHVVSSLTYRTIDYANLVDQVQDIFEYLHYLKNNAVKYRLNLEHLMLTGDSAGAQLSLLCYCINQSEALQNVFNVKPVDLQFDCIALTHPVCFIDQAGKIPRSPWLSQQITIPGLQTMLYGKEFDKDQTYHHSVNPSRYISEEIEFPPILLVTSEGDSLFKYQTFLLADFFNRMNIPYELFVENNKSAQHVYNVSNPERDLAEKCNRMMMDFFEQSISGKYSSGSKKDKKENYVQSSGN